MNHKNYLLILTFTFLLVCIGDFVRQYYKIPSLINNYFEDWFGFVLRFIFSLVITWPLFTVKKEVNWNKFTILYGLTSLCFLVLFVYFIH